MEEHLDTVAHAPARREAVDAESSLSSRDRPEADLGLRRGTEEPDLGHSELSRSEQEDLQRAVQSLAEQVDAVSVAGHPLRERSSFRKRKETAMVAASPSGPVWTAGVGSPTRWTAGAGSPSLPKRPARDPEEAGVAPQSLRHRLIRTMEASLAENISKYAPSSRNTTPMIFASSLMNKLRRVSGQSNLVVVGQSFDEAVIGTRTRRLLEDAGTSTPGILSGSNNSMPAARRTPRLLSVFNSFNFSRAISVTAMEPHGEGQPHKPNTTSPGDMASPGGRTNFPPTPVPNEDEAIAEHICELLFAGSSAVPGQVNEVSDIVNKAATYKPQFSVKSTSGDGHPQDERVGAQATDLTAADKRARTMRAQLLVIVGAQVAVFVVETTTFISQQVFWGNAGPFCVMREGEPNTVYVANLVVLICLVSWHLLRALQCWITLAISLGTLPQWAAYSLHKNSTVEQVAAEATMWTTLIVMTALTVEEEIHKCTDDSYNSFTVYRRLHSAVHLLRMIMAAHACFVLRQDARRLMQVAVSGSKRRFVDEEFDLDLTYIADRLIAMALPCVAGAAYRNDIRQVSHFLTSRHYGSFKIFNLCECFEEFSNGNYDGRFFHQQVVRITMRDHNICTLTALVSFCRQATAFLNLDPSNVVVVHCRGGKGRTGTFCASLLLWSDFCTTALEALAAFATRRTDLTRSTLGKTVMQGVASPTQVRYVHYIESIKRLNLDYLSRRCTCITRVVVRGVPRRDIGGALVTFIIETSAGIVYDHAKEQGLVPCYEGEGDDGGSTFVFDIPNILIIRDASVRFFYFDKNVGLYSVKRRNCELSKGGQVLRYRISDDEMIWGKQLMFVQWHTSFHDTPTMTYGRTQIDGVYAKHPKQFALDFSLEVMMEGPHIEEADNRRRNQDPQTQHQDPGRMSRGGTAEVQEQDDAQGGDGGGGEAAGGSRASSAWGLMGGRRQSYPHGIYGTIQPPKTRRQDSWRTAMELVDEYRQLPETFRLGGAEELMFAKGDRVRGTDSTDRSLMLIVSGHVAVFPDSRRKWANAGYFNPGLYRFEMHRGDGDMLGELDFLLGAGADTTTPLVVCTSDHLVVLKLHLAANHPTLEPPLLEERIGEENSMLLYEMLARGLATRAIRLDCLIANAHADLVKRDQVTSTSDNQDVLDQGLAALRKEFRIALSQECFMRMSCKLRDGANVSRGCLWFLGQWCQIYVFSEQVFLKLSGGRSVQFLVKSIHSVEAVGSQVTLFLAEEPNSVNFDSGSEKPEKQMINTFQVEMLVQGSSRKQSFDHNAQNFPTFSKFRLGSSAKQSETDSKHTKRDLESRCYETTRLEFFDCGSALAARDMIRKQCAWYERAGVRGESPFGSMSPPRHSVTHSVLASRRRKQSVLMIHADKHQDKFQPDGDTGAATRTIKELAPDSWTASDYFASSFKSLSSGLEAELPGPENIEDIIGDLPQVDFHKGDVILQEGSCDRALYVVVQGFVLAQTADGRVLVRREPGEVFGEVSMYDTGNRGASCSVVAGSITTGVKIINLPAMKRSAMENPLQISRLHRFVARTLAVRAQSQVRRDTVFLD